MKDKNISFILPFLLWFIVTLAYAFRSTLQTAGFPIDPYFLLLYAFPIILLILNKISSADMGFRIGKPGYGLFFLLLLPGILFLRYYFMGLPMQLTANWLTLVVISVAEEFFFRGYLQSQFEKSFNNTTISFSLTNFLFLLVHVVKGYSILSSVMTGLIGVYFSFAKDKSGGDSLAYSAGAHSLYNLVASSVQRIGGNL